MTKIQGESVPTILRAIRTKLDLTQEQLAERLGTSFATVNRWEGGTNRPQRAALDTIAALATEAGVVQDQTPATDAAAGVTGRRRKSGGSTPPTTKPMEQM